MRTPARCAQAPRSPPRPLSCRASGARPQGEEAGAGPRGGPPTRLSPASPAWLACRIVPASSHHFLLRHLVPGADYDLCLLALSPAAGPSDLTATRLLGCAHFSTPPATPLCHALQAHVLGGTLTVAVGGVLVAALLVFTVALLVRGRGTGNGRLPLKLSHVQSQTNGGPSPTPKSRPPRSPPPRPQRSCSLDLGDAGGCYGYARRLGGAWARRSHSVHGGLLATGCRRVGGSAERLEESVV